MAAKTTRPSITAASWLSWSREIVSASTAGASIEVVMTFQRTRVDRGARPLAAVQLLSRQGQVGDVVHRRMG